MKHNKWWIIGCIVFGLLLYTLPMTPLGYIISKEETLTNRIMMKVARKITTEKELYLIGTAAQMMYEIQMLGLSFQGFRDISLDEARELIVFAVETFVNEVNSNEKIHPYLANYPFNANNIEISLVFFKPDYSEVDAPNISFVVTRKGYIKYYYGTPEYNINEPCLVESYEEAFQILTKKKENPHISSVM